MSKVIKIKQGMDIKLQGEAEMKISEFSTSKYAVKPTDFIGVFPKLLVKEGDLVEAGTPLFFDKAREDIKITAPVSGKVTDIVRGQKRVLLEIRIEADAETKSIDFGKADPLSMDRGQIIEKMQEAGVWATVLQRPYKVIANPEDQPKSIFVSAFDSSPLATDHNMVVEGRAQDFQAGLNALTKLTEGKVYLNLPNAKKNSEIFTQAKNVEITYFEGPHPVGNVGVQINKISPINKGEVVWTLKAQDVLTLGKLFNDGVYSPEKVIALTGSEVEKPQYYKLKSGACVADLFKNNLKQQNVRFISGNVLTGDKIAKDGYIGFYHNQLTVIPEGNYHTFVGWALPHRPDKHSFYRSFFSWITPNKKYSLDTNLNGGTRAFVVSGAFEKVFPFDIYPVALLKAIMIEDIDAMENLGIYEIDEEDFALCEYISTSKIEIQSVVRRGLNMMYREMN
jgi:Na+-transporting NADH:ubiquinone oxidoreductase subunit A